MNNLFPGLASILFMTSGSSIILKRNINIHLIGQRYYRMRGSFTSITLVAGLVSLLFASSKMLITLKRHTDEISMTETKLKGNEDPAKKLSLGLHCAVGIICLSELQ